MKGEYGMKLLKVVLASGQIGTAGPCYLKCVQR